MTEHAQTVVLMAGSAGTGKSMLAGNLGRPLGWPVIDKDTHKSTLLAGGVAERLAASLAYDLMFAEAGDVLAQGFSVILDSPASYLQSVENARRLAAEASAYLRVVLCTADVTLRETRLRERTPRLSQPSLPDERPMDEAHRYAHLPSDTLTVETGLPADDVLARVRAYVLGAEDGA